MIVTHRRSPSRALLLALAACSGFALLEGALAGADVAEQYASMRLPAYSPPLWGWFVIGGVYYAICFVVLYRVLRIREGSKLKQAAVTLALLMMGINAAWSVVFFGEHDFRLAFFACIPYDIVAVALFLTLLKLDRFAARSFTPYLLYLVYANVWGYGVWQANAVVGP